MHPQSDTLRLRTPIHDGAPHGRYIVEDGDKRFLFRFFKGDDINQALADAKANLARTDSEAQQTQRGTDPQPTGQSDVNLVAVPGAAVLSTFANTARATVTSAFSALTSHSGAWGADHAPPIRFGYSRLGERSSTLREGPSVAPIAQGPRQQPPAEAQQPPAEAQQPPTQSPNQQRPSRSQNRQPASRTQQPHAQPQQPPVVQQPLVISQQPQASVATPVMSQTPRVLPSQAPRAAGSVMGFVHGRHANSLMPIGSIDQTQQGLFYCVTLR
ncbi:hypothetical protein C2E23DRAFT_389157 [Lenzites betulinus]|nr:hypothetical protein C2E23DRAFT_389157 [Lenzites betulinus]